MINYQAKISFLNQMATNTASLLNAKFAGGSRTSDIFVTRVELDGSIESDMIEMEVKNRVKFLNEVTKGIRGNSRFRVLRKGRAPVAGAKYGRCGTLLLKDATAVDLYITVSHM